MAKHPVSMSQKSGLPPGSAVYTGEKRTWPVSISVIDYDSGAVEKRDILSLDECKAYKDRPTVTWINVNGLHEAHVIEQLGAIFDIHPLTIEDILHTVQRPKIDVFDDYVYLVIKMHQHDDVTEEITSEQVSIVLGKNFIISFQEKEGDPFDPVRNRITNNFGRIRKMGADYLAYSLIDSVVDHCFVVLEKIGEKIESLEEELLEQPSPEVAHAIHALKREMILLRKSFWPLRELVNSILRDEVPWFSDEITIYLKDLYDHIIQVIDTIESYRDIISGMLDIYLTSISNRMNEIMKVLTIFASIFIPLTFIAGLYGMNFNTSRSPFNMPELNWYYGYPFALLLMVATVVAMIIYFKRKNWF